MKARPARKPGEVTLKLDRRDEPLMDAANGTAPRSPLKLKHILVPIDFSDCSAKALDYAFPLAKEHKSVITLLYVAEPAYGAGEYGGVDYAQLEKGVKEEGEEELARIAGERLHGEVSVVTLVRVGSASREIVEVAKILLVDLIVISTHGRTGLKHALLGSVAEHVVQRAPCPVFVVREREREILAA